MAIDQLMLLADTQTVTASAIGNNIMPLSTTRQFGTGARPLYVDCRAITALTDSDSNSTVDVIIQSSPYVGINSSITNTTIGQFATNAAIGARVLAALPPLGADKAFLAVYFSVAGGDLSTGSFTCWLTPDPEVWTAHPVGWTGPSTS